MSKFDCMDVMSGDDLLSYEAGFVKAYFKDITEYILSLKDSPFRGYSSDELHDAADALDALYGQAHDALDAIRFVRGQVKELAYNREDDEAYEAEEARINKDHDRALNSWWHDQRI